MLPDRRPAALAAGIAAAAGFDLTVDRTEVLQDSNRLVIRAMPCDTLIRVGEGWQLEGAERELRVARALAELGAPVGAPDPRVPSGVVRRDGFAVSFWTYHPPVEPRSLDSADYASTLRQVHEALRVIDVSDGDPHFLDRADLARSFAADHAATPRLADADRTFLVQALDDARAACRPRARAVQLLHGEPHGDNVLRTEHGLLLTDLEALCVGPVEFDVADCPEDVAAHYPGLDVDLLHACRTLVIAMVATWCWQGHDAHENLRRNAIHLTDVLRSRLA